MMIERLRELFQYRELIRNLVARDLKVRYRNSVLGFIWCLGNPLLLMVVFTLMFTILMPNQIEKFPIFVLCALLPWNFFSTAVMGGISSIVNNAHLIKKVYFPREVLPISVVLAALVNFLLSLVVLFVMLFVFKMRIVSLILLLPLIIFIQLIFTLGVSLFLATLNVFYRDTEVIMEVVMLAWFFLTPIFYRVEDLVPRYSRLMYIVNPMASLISSYRIILYYSAPPDIFFLARTFVTALVVLVIGYLFFMRYSRVFGEEV